MNKTERYDLMNECQNKKKEEKKVLDMLDNFRIKGPRIRCIPLGSVLHTKVQTYHQLPRGMQRIRGPFIIINKII